MRSEQTLKPDWCRGLLQGLAQANVIYYLDTTFVNNYPRLLKASGDLQSVHFEGS